MSRIWLTFASCWGGRSRWARAARRRALIDRYLWVDQHGFYRDLDLRTGRPLAGTPRALSSFVPLWAGVADASQAARMVQHLPLFEHEHGLAACERGWADGTEHNYPTGWAYSHWYVATGLRRCGYRQQASRIALKWLRLVAHRFERTGLLLERYNVVDPDGPTPGRYRPRPDSGGPTASSPHCSPESCLESERTRRLRTGCHPRGDESGFRPSCLLPVADRDLDRMRRKRAAACPAGGWLPFARALIPTPRGRSAPAVPPSRGRRTPAWRRRGWRRGQPGRARSNSSGPPRR
jgi:Trehalase